MITKTNFIKIINAIIEQDKQDDKTGDAITSILDQSHYPAIFSTPLTQTLISILNNEVGGIEGDKNIGDDISYWLYEAKCGKHFDKVWVEGKEISIKTPSDLYDYLYKYGANRERRNTDTNTNH